MKNNILWSVSLMIIGIITIILVGSNIMEVILPAMLKWIFGVIDIVAVAILIYSSIKRRNEK